MATPTLFENLVENRDILERVVHDYLESRDVLNLDLAVVETESRGKFHYTLSQGRYRVPFQNELETWWKHHKSILKWVVSRGMYYSEGVWHVNQKLWETMVADPQYHQLLATIRGVRFENFSGSSSLEGLERCVQLERLEICNLTSPKENPTPVNLPLVQFLYIQNTNMNEHFMNIFGETPRLTKVQFHHARYTEVSEEVAERFINRFHTLSIIGDLDGFLAKMVRRTTNLREVTIDKMHKAEPNPMDLSDFLQKIPEVRMLSVDRMKLHIPSFFKCLTAYNPRLHHLHLNHIRLNDNPTTVPDDKVSLTVTTLQISTLLPGTVDDTKNILQFTKTVNHLTLSFMSKLDIDFLKTLKTKELPHLHSLEIHERKENLSDVEGAVEQYHTLTAEATEGFKLVEWPEWKSEREKGLYPEQAKVLIDTFPKKVQY